LPSLFLLPQPLLQRQLSPRPQVPSSRVGWGVGVRETVRGDRGTREERQRDAGQGTGRQWTEPSVGGAP
jgi:hypothetical protein